MNWNFPKYPQTLTALVLVLGLSANALAQNTDANSSTVVYPADYFTQYAPVTAQDMLERIPGLSSGGGRPPGGGGGGGGGGGNPGAGGGGNPGAGGRGFGGGGGGQQILVNGKRVAGKDNETSAMLDRITSSQVDYIEIIRGTSGSLDVRGSNQIVNVVLFGELTSSTFSYEVNMDRYDDSKTQPGGSAVVSGQVGSFKYLASVLAEPRYDHYVSNENSILGNFTPNDEVHEERIREQTTYQFSTNLTYDFSDNSSARLNGLYAENDNPTEVTREIVNLKVRPFTVVNEREDIPGEQDNWEIGGDYEYRWGNGSRYKILFISNEDNVANTRERYRVNANGSETKNLFLDSASVTKERIVRSSYTRNLLAGQDLEVGIERAQTILDSNLRLGTLSAIGTPSANFGGLVPQAVSNANSRVEEIRYEPFAIHNWQINPRMSLESTLVYESSEITQSGDVYNQRSFDFWKPKVDYRFDLTSTFQLRASVAKEVRQLSFSDFVAATDNQDNDANTQAGNADLRQETFINADFTAEYRLPNDLGVLDGGINFMRHYDKIERIDVSPSPTDLQSANGNISDGDMWVLSLNSSIRMSMFDMPNLLVTTNLQVRDSEIEDPFLGITRRFTNFERGRLNLGFRHDLPQYAMNYGLSWNNRFDGNIKRYDIDDLEMTAGDPMVNAFVEFVRFNGITFRFDARNATDNLQCRERHRYVGHMAANILEEIEDQCGGSGPVVSLKVNGTF